MTTSRETNSMDHPTLRRLVDEVAALTLDERVTLLKALIPGVAEQMTPRDFEALALELRMKGERFYDAKQHPGEGRAARHVMGERDLEGR
ncbi:MAG TPA: hypothetical protein VF118_17180 [Gemmatimonadaceae bacterium]